MSGLSCAAAASAMPELRPSSSQLARIDLKTGGVAVVRLAGARGELVLLLRPREIDRICGRDRASA